MLKTILLSGIITKLGMILTKAGIEKLGTELSKILNNPIIEEKTKDINIEKLVEKILAESNKNINYSRDNELKN
jgi:hypothetical protein